MKKHSTQIEFILKIIGESFDPEELTDVLAVQPTHEWKKGEKNFSHSNLIATKEVFRREAAWKYSTGCIESLDSEEVSKQIESVFGNKLLILKNYVDKKKLEIILEIVIKIEDNKMPSLHFTKEFLGLINHLEAEIDIDMYM